MEKEILTAAQKGVILFDDAIGTQLQTRGLPISSSSESWNRLHPEGPRFIGGCCGTTPDHIRAFHHLIKREV